MKKPVLAQKNGFFSKFVEFYKLGLTIDLQADNFPDIFDKIGYDKFLYDEFLETHKWEVFAKRLSGL